MGTYRGWQIMGKDTVVFYVRTVSAPSAPLVEDDGDVSGYALQGVASASLDSLEVWVGRGMPTDSAGGGNALFVIEGTQPPETSARTLYPAAFLGRLAAGESPAADSLYAVLETMQVDLEAPDLGELSGRGIPHELFRGVAEGVMAVDAAGSASYHQENRLPDDRVMVLQFERISGTTLPEPAWLPAELLGPSPPSLPIR